MHSALCARSCTGWSGNGIMAKPACFICTVNYRKSYRQKGALLGRVAGGDVHDNSGNCAGVAAWSKGRVLRQRASVPGEYIAEPMSRDAKRCPQGNTTMLSEFCTLRAVCSVTAAAKVSPALPSTTRAAIKELNIIQRNPARCAQRRALTAFERNPVDTMPVTRDYQ